MDGLQRVLLFTADKNLVTTLQASRDIEVPTADYTLMLQGIGLSLVDASKCREILYMRIASSGVQWESQKPGKRQRFKPMPFRKSSVIEFSYQNYLNEKIVNPAVKSHVNLDGGIEVLSLCGIAETLFENSLCVLFQVDFVEMKMLKPNERNIRRMFQTGLWVHYRTYPHTLLLHAKLNRLQIDNQLSDGIFQTVLAPVPPPRSISNDDG